MQRTSGRHELEDHDLGLSADLGRFMDRRVVLGLFAGAGVAALTGCAGGGVDTTTSSPSATATSPAGSATTPAAAGSCEQIPRETAGPYPGDGSNGPNVLTESGVARSDIRSSFGSAIAVADGIPLTVTLTVQDNAAGCAPRQGAAVYLWHCDREGQYSMYSQAVANENFLRGVQEAGADGTVTFTTIFPGCYAGRWPHIHFEIYPSLAEATTASNRIITSQLAFPPDACAAVYATEGYSASVDNLARVSLQTDNVFSDGYDRQLAAMTGDVTTGYTATLAVPV